MRLSSAAGNVGSQPRGTFDPEREDAVYTPGAAGDGGNSEPEEPEMLAYSCPNKGDVLERAFQVLGGGKLCCSGSGDGRAIGGASLGAEAVALNQGTIDRNGKLLGSFLAVFGTLFYTLTGCVRLNCTSLGKKKTVAPVSAKMTSSVSLFEPTSCTSPAASVLAFF